MFAASARRGACLQHCTQANCAKQVGAPIPVPLIAEPTEAQVEQFHAAYVAGLQSVFDENKAACGYADAELRLV